MPSLRISILISIIYIFGSLCGFCNGCGGLVHGELAQRSRFLFALQHQQVNSTNADPFPSRIAGWLQRYDGAILAGSFMPDWGYGCSGADDLSETMHWPPFLKAAVEYIREKYPHPEESEQAQALIAFIFAIAGHQVQDAAWHSIGLLMGMIDEVARVDCHGSFAIAHETLDWGGDAILGKRFSAHKGSADWAFGDWLVPVDDIAAIYKRMGKNLSVWQMKYCIVRLRGVLLADAKGASLFFKRFGQKSPFMLDYFDSYYLGGLDDMTSTTVECWTNLIEWMKTGQIGNPWELCPLTAAITRRTDSAIPCVFDQMTKDLKTEIDEINEDLHAEDRDGLFRIWYSGHRHFMYNQHVSQPPSREVSSQIAYARFGQSMALGYFGLGDSLQLAVSSPFQSHESHSPHTGDIRIFSINKEEISPDRNIRPASSPHSPSDYPGLRFGYSLAAFNLQNQNQTVLAVGSPGSHPSGLVHIYTGSPHANVDVTPQLTIVPFNEIWFKSQYGKRVFGSKLFVADVDGDGKDDLLISSSWSDFTGYPTLPDPPDTNTDENIRRAVWDTQHGSIAVFTGNQLEMMMGGHHVLDEDCAYYISSPSAYGFERFGSSIAFAKKAGVLLVGEPGAGKNSSYSGRGKVYGIRIAEEQRFIEFEIDGPEIAENAPPTEFGGGGLTSGVTKDGTEWFAVASQNEKYEDLLQAGIVRIYTLEEKYNKTSNSSYLLIRHAFSLRGEEPQLFGKFGAVMESDGVNRLWISSGWANEEDGVVWSFNITDGLPKFSHKSSMEIQGGVQEVFKPLQREPKKLFEVAKIFAKGIVPKGRFGDSLLVGDFNKDGIQDLAVGSPFAYGEDESNPLAGKIQVFFLG